MLTNEIHFKEILSLINNARITALKTVNKQLIDLYWEIGKHVSIKVENDGWGKGVVLELSSYIQSNEPEIKGFSVQNIWRMKQFFETYRDYPLLSTMVRDISWSSNLHIISKTKTIEEKEFYLNLSIKEKYSTRELERQIDSRLFERNKLSEKKLSTVLREIHPKAENVFRDKYLFDFLNLTDNYSENDFRKALLLNFKKFVLEIGKDFALIGEEYRIQVGNKDFFIDLLFYHRELCCLVAFELKIDDFKPEYLGKLNFYLEAIDRDVKKDYEKPSVGVLLCKSKDNDVVEYALSRNLSPALIAEYETKLIDKKLLQSKLHELTIFENE